MPATLKWPRQSIGGGCQSSEKAVLLNSLYFAFTNSFLSKNRVKYYDYIVIGAVGYNEIGVCRWSSARPAVCGEGLLICRTA